MKRAVSFLPALLLLAGTCLAESDNPLTEINRIRDQAGLPPVEVSLALQAAAEPCAHVAAADDGVVKLGTVRTYANDAGYPAKVFPLVGTRDHTDGAEMVRSLMQNGACKAAILSSAKDIGWASARGRGGKLYWMVLLGAGNAPATLPVSQGSEIGGINSQNEAGRDEVIRRGDMVEQIGADGERFASAEDEAIAQFAAAPPTDNEKWFISVWASKKCPACTRLKELWKSDPTLRAYAKPENPKDSFAHFTWYYTEDPYQKWRLEPPSTLRIERVPTIVVQPPRWKNAEGQWVYGNPNDVVLKYVWDGSPERLSKAINSSIRAYVSTLNKKEASKDNDVLPPSGFGATERPVEAAGFGQQVVPPPLVLPLDDRPPADDSRRDIRGGKQQILIVTDSELRTTDAQQEAIDNVVRELQDPSDPCPVRVVDVTKAKGLDVKPEDIPVVLLTEGRNVVERRRVPQTGFPGPILSGWFGIGKITGAICGAIGVIVFWGMLLLAGIVSVKILQRAEILPKPLWGKAPVAVAPAPAPQPTAAPAPAPTPPTA